MPLSLSPKSLAFRIQQLSVLPVLICITLIGIGFALLQAQENRVLDHKRSHLAAHWLATLSKGAVIRDDIAYITQVFGDLLEIPNVRGVYLVAPDKQVTIQLGLRPMNNIAERLTDSPTQWQLGDNHYYSVPLVEQTVGGAQLLGWVVFSVNRGALNALQYQIIIVTLFAILVASFTLILMAWRLTRTLEVSLDNSQRTLQDFTRQNFASRAPLEGCAELQKLAKSINELGHNLEQAQHDVRQQIEQATSDLQETLETVEIQSIELDIARRHAVAASRAKSEFLANTTHEIRTPINGILGFTNLLLKSPLTTQQREYLRTIAHSSQGLLTIINDILDFSRLEEDELSLDRAPFNLRQVIEETLQILAPSASEKQLYLIATSDPDVPHHVLGDALRLKQILINLVSNAIKFSDSGDIVVTTRLLTDTPATATVKISVQDSGIGIDPQLAEAMFEPFKQADASDSRIRGGTGLGLAIAKGLVEKMGGNIRIDSMPERGTTVWFTLPLPKQHLLMQSSEDELRGKSALIYVANPQIRCQLVGYLDHWGIHYRAFASLSELQSHCRPTSHSADGEAAADFMFIAAGHGHLEPNSLAELKQVFTPPILVATLPDSPLAYNESLHTSGMSLLFLPLSRDHLYQVLCDALITSRVYPPLTAALPYPRARVLVVDDNAANLQLVSTVLDSIGVIVHQASSGAAALAIMAAHPIDLVFMDVQMPVMDGIETTRQIREREHSNQHVPIVALTAHNVNEHKTKILKAGMNDCISKPVSEEQLIHILQHWLDLPGMSDRQQRRPERNAGSLVPQSAVMNLQESLRLTNNNKELARQMLSKLTESLPADAEAILSLYQEQRWTELQERVHHLHGGCCYCGVPELRQAIADMDAALVQNEHSALNHKLNGVLKAIQRLREWVEAHDLDIIFDIDNR